MGQISDILQKGLFRKTLIKNGGEDTLGKNTWKGYWERLDRNSGRELWGKKTVESITC